MLTAQFATPLVSLSLTGRRGSEAWGEMLPLAAGQPAQGHRRAVGARPIEALSDAMVNGDAASIKPLIVETALAHHLVSKYTSLVAVDVTPTLPPGAASELDAVPVNLPAGSRCGCWADCRRRRRRRRCCCAIGAHRAGDRVCAAFAVRRTRRGGRALRDRVTRRAARLLSR